MKIYDEEETLIENASTPLSGERPELSVFLPVYNEEPNLLPLQAKLDEALKALGRTAEIIYVAFAWLRCGATTVRPRRWPPASMPPAGRY